MKWWMVSAVIAAGCLIAAPFARHPLNVAMFIVTAALNGYAAYARFRADRRPGAALTLPVTIDPIEVIRQRVPLWAQRAVARNYGLDEYLFPEPPPLEASEASEEITGWRAWRVISSSGAYVLQSLYLETSWPGGCALTAPNLTQFGIAKDGIHAFKDASGVEAELAGPPLAEIPPPLFGYATGTVALWGRVIEHEFGYRAEFAYPQRLTVESAEIAQSLARLYGCEVEVASRAPGNAAEPPTSEASS